MWDWLALRLRLLLLLRLLELLLMLLSGVPIADGEETNFVCCCVPEVEALGEDEVDALAGFEGFAFFRTFSSESVPLLSGAFLLS